MFCACVLTSLHKVRKRGLHQVSSARSDRAVLEPLPFSQTLDFVTRNVFIRGFPDGSEVKASACNSETWVRSLGWEDPLEKEMATHSSILAWRIPWTEEPGGLQSTGSQRVGHD